MARIDIDIAITNEKKLDELDKKLKAVDESQTIAKVDVKTDGAEEIDKLNEELDKTVGKTKKSSDSMVKWAAAVAVVGAALATVISAGREYRDTLDEMNGVSKTYADTTKSLKSHFGQLSDSIMNNSKIQGLWNKVAKEANFTMEWWSKYFSGKTSKQLKEERKLVEDSTKVLKEKNTALKAEKKTLENLAKIQRDYLKRLDDQRIKLENEKSALMKKKTAEEESIYTQELAAIGYDNLGYSIDGAASSQDLYSDSTDEIQTQLDDLETKIENTKNKMSDYSEEISKQKTTLDKTKTATDKVATSTKKVETAANETKDATKKYTGELDNAKESLQDNKEGNDKVRASLKLVENQTRETTAEMYDYIKSLNKAVDAEKRYYTADYGAYGDEAFGNNSNSSYNRGAGRGFKSFEYQMLKKLSLMVNYIKETNTILGGHQW